MESSEKWKSIRKYKGMYEVSTKGRVRSTERILQQRIHGKLVPRKWPSKILKQVDQDGYPVISLYLDGEQNTVKVHSLVISTFIGNRPKGLITRHLNDNKWDNRLENLCYGTVQDNVNDKFSNGYKTHLRKLPKKSVVYILKSKLSGPSLAVRFDVDKSTIYDIRKGKFYKEIYDEVMCEKS